MQSVFFPQFDARYLKWNGYWVNEQGFYWNEGARFRVKHPRWGEYWDQYWEKDWHAYWHRHWEKNHENPRWHYRDREMWHEHWYDHRDAHKK
jgi:hypothetical protein